MFYGILATILESLDTILWKKSLDLNKMPSFLFSGLGYTGDFLMAFSLFFLGYFNRELITNYEIVSIIGGLVFLQIILNFIEQKLYANEKVSALIPYEYLSSIFIVIISFFLFGDVSIITFIITMIAIVVITIFSIDFKKFVFPKSFKLILLTHSIRAIKMLTLGYLLLSISNYDYFTIFSIIFFVINLLVFISRKYYKELKKGTKQFFGYRFSASFIGTFSELLSLFIIAELGLILATLLGFLGLVSTLIFGFFILKEKPEKKDILLAFIVLTLISTGYYFE